MATKKGFTLSEIMVAVVIVGFLASILIPVIVKVSPSSNKVMFKKEHAVLEKAIAGMISDELRYPPGLTGDGDLGAKVQLGFNNTNIITSGLGAMNMPSGVNKFCYLLGDSLDTLGTLNATSCPPSSNGTFKTSDGAVWTVVYGTFPLAYNDFTTKVVIDVNGIKPPNCFTDTGYSSYKPVVAGITYTACQNAKNPDTFIFGVRYDGKLQIGSGVGTDVNAENILKSVTVNTPDK